MNYENPLVWAVLFALGIVVGYVGRHIVAGRFLKSAEHTLSRRLEDAQAQAQSVILEAQKQATALLEEAKHEEREAKTQLTKLEERLIKKEETLDAHSLELRSHEERVRSAEERVARAEEEVRVSRDQALRELERVAGFTAADAKDVLLREMQTRYGNELAQALQKLEHERRDAVEKRSQEIITTAIQRYARSHVSELTTTPFHLADEDMKGKIIGREGRNIRALERATGVEFIIDETPDSVIISSFDPLRREIARLALEKLVKDGRIQPAKIEDKVEEARNELDRRMHEIGEAAAYEVGIFDFPKEILQLLGRLHFRTSFGQNVLVHSIEMAHVAGMIAADLGASVDVAKKGALVHDIGKAIDHEVQGTHVELGRKILKKYGVSDAVVAAMESHHEDYPFSTPESYIVAAADALSAGRPGARRGTLENYIKRLGDLEKIASSFPGVKQSYAISGGRELRIFVIPEKIDDFGALQLAKNIATKIESELHYPGEIKVNVIREMKAVEYAR